jgi:hypothetical protein
VWQRLLQCDESRFFVEMTQKTQDQLAADAEFGTPLFERTLQAVDDGVEGDAALGVCLRVEKDLRVQHVILLATQQVSPAQVEKILLLDEDIGALVVDIEEGLQVAELVGGSDFVGRSEGYFDAIAPRQLEHQLRLEAALDVQVQFDLGQFTNESFHKRQSSHKNAFPVIEGKRTPRPCPLWEIGMPLQRLLSGAPIGMDMGTG